MLVRLKEPLRGACGYSRSADGAFIAGGGRGDVENCETETLIARLLSLAPRSHHDVGADDDALPDFPTDDFTPPPTSAYWLKEMCVNSANLIDTICSIRCGECAEKEDAFYTCFNGEACSAWYSPKDFTCEGYDGDSMYDQETCCLKDHEI